MRRLILLGLITCITASFCINGIYEYSYDWIEEGTNRGHYGYRIQSYSTAMVLDLKTEKLFSKRIDQLLPGDYILSHNGYFTYVTNTSVSYIDHPQLYYRDHRYNTKNAHIDVGLDIYPDCTNIVFTDSQLNLVNNSMSISEDNGISVYQFGLYNFTDNIKYDMRYSGYSIMYYINGIDVINKSEILDFIIANNITTFERYDSVYSNLSATIYPCDAIDITTESGSATINGLFFF